MSQDNTNSSLREKIQEIAIDLIDVPGKNPRGLMDDDHVIDLSGNIATNGLLQTIGVKPTDNGRYELIWGFHRLAAVMRLHWEKITATIRPNNGTNTKILSLCENIVRKNMTLEEEIEAVGQLTRVEKMSPAMICSFTNRSRAWVDRRLMAPGLPAKVKEVLFEGLISLAHAEIIGNITNEGTRNMILNQVIYGKYTISQTEDIVEMYLSNPTLETAIQEGSETTRQVQVATQILKPCAKCGTLRQATELTYVPICMNGCPEKEEPKQEE